MGYHDHYQDPEIWDQYEQEAGGKLYRSDQVDVDTSNLDPIKLKPAYNPTVLRVASELLTLHPSYQEILRKSGSEMVAKRSMLQVAVLATTFGANPMAGSGEVWAYWDNRRQAVTVMLGIAFYRRLAREQDGVCYVWDKDCKPRSQEPHVMDAEMRVSHGLMEQDFGSVCRMYRIGDYTGLIASGMPWHVAQWSSSVQGVGIVKHEHTIKAQMPPNGRTWQWVSDKRCEMDAYRKLGLLQKPASAHWVGAVIGRLANRLPAISEQEAIDLSSRSGNVEVADTYFESGKGSATNGVLGDPDYEDAQPEQLDEYNYLFG